MFEKLRLSFQEHKHELTKDSIAMKVQEHYPTIVVFAIMSAITFAIAVAITGDFGEAFARRRRM